MGLRTRRLGTRLVLKINTISSPSFIKLQQCYTVSGNVLDYRKHKGGKYSMKSICKFIGKGILLFSEYHQTGFQTT